MSVYLITYDLKSPGRNYQGLYEEFKKWGDSVCHLMQSTFIVCHKGTAREIFYSLQRHMD